jgi:hypothetical protein
MGAAAKLGLPRQTLESKVKVLGNRQISLSEPAVLEFKGRLKSHNSHFWTA